MANTNVNHETRIDNFLARQDITVGERSFGQSLLSSVKKWKTLTDKQWSAFQRMEARYSPEALRAKEQWVESWDEEKAENLKAAVVYYTANPYYQNIISKITMTEGYIPNKKEYDALITNNKYMLRVLETMRTAPLFATGSLVQIRKTQILPHKHKKLKNRLALVVSNEGDITSATKGARPYLVLPFGHDKTISIEERWLKRAK